MESVKNRVPGMIKLSVFLIALIVVFAKDTAAGSEGFQSVSTTRVGGFIYSATIDLQDHSTLYVGGSRGFFRSTNGGSHWEALNGPPTLADFVSIAIDPNSSNIIYAATVSSGEIWKSTDSGHSWARLNIRSGLDDIQAGWWSSLAVDPKNTNLLYAAHAGYDEPYPSADLFKSKDGGITWQKTPLVNRGSDGVYLLVIDPQDPQVLYAGDSLDLYQSTDGGETWKGITGFGPIASVTIDPQNSQTLYVGTQGHGLFKSADRGATWSWIGPSTTVHSVLVDREDSQTVYAAAKEGLFKSVDGGMNWRPLKSELSADVYGLITDPANSNTMYARGSKSLLKTVDGGATWTTIFETFGTPVLAIDRALYCGEDSWTLNVSNAVPGSAIRLSGISNGQTWQVLQWQVTDIDGTHQESGTFSHGTEGSHKIRVEVDGIPSNEISFTVSKCGP
jgi:photosystem II stability/assembly factor-like uncharacterized protein